MVWGKTNIEYYLLCLSCFSTAEAELWLLFSSISVWEESGGIPEHAEVQTHSLASQYPLIHAYTLEVRVKMTDFKSVFFTWFLMTPW